MKNQKLIDNYLSRTLSAEDTVTFNELLQSDVDFKKEVQFHKDLQKVTEFEDDTAFKKTLQQFESEFQPKKNNYTKWLVAASIAILIGFGSMFYFQTTSNQELFAENFEPYRNIIQPIVRGEVSDNIKTHAFTAYEKGDYKQAITLFSEIQKTETATYYSFYIANSYLALDNTSEAILLFKNYIATKGEFSEKAYWYLALAYLKEETTSEAKQILRKITEAKTYNYKKAAILLKQLK
ncbi:MAG: hypothetical protein COB12_03420 [Flavobacterium sp.]|nr:MAG: hypothetical protein COB12_03420 [Flavobacterium sp.]